MYQPLNIGGYDARILYDRFQSREDCIYVLQPSAANFIRAYQLASQKTTVYGVPRSHRNPVKIFLMPGIYDFGTLPSNTLAGFVLSADYIHIVGLGDSPQDVVFKGHYDTTSYTTDIIERHFFVQTAYDVLLENFSIEITANTNFTGTGIHYLSPFQLSVISPLKYTLNRALNRFEKTNHGLRNRQIIVFDFDDPSTPFWLKKEFFYVCNVTAHTFQITYRPTSGHLNIGGSGTHELFHHHIQSPSIYRKLNIGSIIAGPYTNNNLPSHEQDIWLSSHLKPSVWLGRFEDCKFGDFVMCNAECLGVFIRCEAGHYGFGGGPGGPSSNNPCNISGIFENCRALDRSFGGPGWANHKRITGTFKNCIGNHYSFGAVNEIISTPTKIAGIFENCKGQNYSFGGGLYHTATLEGKFLNCVGGNYSFGGISLFGDQFQPRLFGIFENCIGGDYSFGGGYGNSLSSASAELSGYFLNCIGGEGAFGTGGIRGGILSGRFVNCIGGNKAFGSCLFNAGHGGVLSGIFIDCIGGNQSFGSTTHLGLSGGQLSGKFIRCVGGLSSFGDGYISGGLLNGDFYGCQAGDYSFGRAHAGSGGSGGILNGQFHNCQAGNYSYSGHSSSDASSGGEISGLFMHCSGGIGSFGVRDFLLPSLSGKIFFCRTQETITNPFGVPIGGGIIRACLDGNFNNIS